ncbi:hypothetical protein AKJ43_00600 [candidate division MSBL1 archaeon SCGC-AAA261D19]|uniref:Uncharacterized protein n=1 Tax=candidate division MSBL1 archaeon SCGC-AAA261D19 TaxID=1698273 RepID=A0A133V8I6_9EURY|nr:hypothetical protein AKJ43_00600 [candidate division MSBL1 archaeon SCGC-AAA261D19]
MSRKGSMEEEEATSTRVPHLFDVFNYPEIKAVRATTSLRAKVKVEEVLESTSKTCRIRTANKDVAKFEFGRGEYLLLFPNGYIQIHAPDEEKIRKVLKGFRDELYKCGLIG